MKSSIKSSNVERQDVYTKVTNAVLASLEAGVRPWMKPWSAGHAEGRITLPQRHCGTPYRGINVLLLWGEAMEKGYVNQKWMTFRQAQELGGHVRKGEHGSLVVYANSVTKTEAGVNGEDVERDVHFMRGYTVFNCSQIDGLPEHYYVKPSVQHEKLELIEAAETFFRATGANIQHGGNRAFYAPGPDVIQLPIPEAFRDAESYAATKAHELVHWTKAKHRLDRDFGRKAFGDEGYAREELVAELGAAFLCSALGITPEAREDHAAYIGHWLKVLQDDKRAIFQAAAHAQRAVDFLHSMQQKEEATEAAAA